MPDDRTELTAIRGRIKAIDDSEAAETLYDRYPEAEKIYLCGPMPDGRFEWVMWMK